MYVRFEHYPLPTPTMLTWLTLSVNSLTPSNAIPALSNTLLSGLLAVCPIGCKKFCSAAEERSGPYLYNLPLSRSQQKGMSIEVQHYIS